jgi:hypothetical protein
MRKQQPDRRLYFPFGADTSAVLTGMIEMSAKLMGQVWDLDLPHNQAWVLMALADHADHEGNNVYPGLDLLHYKTGYSERQIRRVLDDLEKAGIIIPISGGIGRGQKQAYRIDMTAAPVKQQKRTKCPQIPEAKSGHFDKTKADKMSANNTGKADILTPEKRTSATLKADILTTSHDKERARINRHEPSEREKEPAQTQSADSLSDLLCTLHGVTEKAGWQLQAKFQSLAIQLDGIGATAKQVTSFWDSRQKKPSLNYFVADFATWRASQNGTTKTAAPTAYKPEPWQVGIERE